MNSNKLLLGLLFTVQIVLGQTSSDSILKQFSKQHQFAKMDSLNSKEKGKDYYFYKGLYANVCNKPKLSNQYLDSLKNSELINSYEFAKLKDDNYIKLFSYNSAYMASKVLTMKFQQRFTQEELLDEINTQQIWKTLRSTRPQSIDKFTKITVAAVKDKAGLITTEVKAKDTLAYFVFDTGAGISCITESTAKKMGVKILPDNNISVESFTGQKNKVRIGVASEINLGELKIHNAVFLVYPDKAFTFADGAYVINGIIGFPIIKELGTITFEKDKLTFSKELESGTNEKNLFVDELRAIVMLKYKDKTLPFNFDSGAKVSLFNKAFYETFKTDLDRIGTLETTKSSSAGAEVVSTEILVLKDQPILLGNKTIQLPKMEIAPKDYGVYGEVNYGNIGQDVLGQFEKVVISFDGNYLKLEN
ncbi:MAG: retropepsin-like aspartic protease [Flavobacterium nitrogenifigens]|uniref:retropepsin-like aspartic protease n=1 Tax=Flavobacterium nitrogenifigens TaxID=1617283 RepID=UPI00280A2DA4|nr:retropepsin-like aspartic protease [Flavobacterium nitrogenifigens]MDQ8015015.1 retropepsin-like aspartic protease [Flavobacterium nitrogenifigens]